MPQEVNLPSANSESALSVTRHASPLEPTRRGKAACLFITVLALECTSSFALPLNDRIQTITTPVEVSAGPRRIAASAFFFHALAPPDPGKTGPQWRAVSETWLVTNRHVLLATIGGKEVLPDSLTFFLRKAADDKLLWHPIRIERDQIENRLRVHRSPTVDIAMVAVHDLLVAAATSQDQLLQWAVVGAEDLAGKGKIVAEVADDVIVIGYPRGFFDQINLYPIVKSGIIASKWGANFNGDPAFLIDAKLFPGSSGSLVLSKPRDFIIDKGQFFMAPEKQFAFLGIYSREPYVELETSVEFEGLPQSQRLGFNVGLVWYGALVDEIARSGVGFVAK